MRNPSNSPSAHSPTKDLDVSRRHFLMTTATSITKIGAMASVAALMQGCSPAEKKTEVDEKAVRKQRLHRILRERSGARRVGEIKNEGHHCLDGRCKCNKGEEIVGGAGGGAGDIAVAVVTLKNLGYDVMKRQTMKDMIDAHDGTIYRHTDHHAVEALHERLHNDPVFHEMTETRRDLEDLLKNGTPNEQGKTRLFGALNEVGTDKKGRKKLRHDGCGHQAYMGGNPELYGMTPELFALYNEEMYEDLWEEGDHEILEPLEGEHEEQFVVEVTFDWKIENDDSVVMGMRPCDEKGGDQIFFYQPQYTEYELRKYGQELKAKVFPGLNVDEFVKEGMKVSDMQFKATGNFLAQGKKVMKVRFHSPRNWSIGDEEATIE